MTKWAGIVAKCALAYKQPFHFFIFDIMIPFYQVHFLRWFCFGLVSVFVMDLYHVHPEVLGTIVTRVGKSQTGCAPYHYSNMTVLVWSHSLDSSYVSAALQFTVEVNGIVFVVQGSKYRQCRLCSCTGAHGMGGSITKFFREQVFTQKLAIFIMVSFFCQIARSHL